MTRPDTGIDNQPGVEEKTGSGGPVLDEAPVVLRTSVPQDDDDVVETPDGPVALHEAKPRWELIDGVVALFFVLSAYYITHNMWTSPHGKTSAFNSTDQTFFEWMLVHALRIFTHGDNPFVTTQLNVPDGVNLMSNTNLLGLGVPLAPLTALVGPGPVFVLIIMMGLAGTAFSWYYVMSRHIVHNRLAGFIGGAFCGFGPGIMTHANNHPNITAQFVLPFIIWRAIALTRSVRPFRDGVILGLLITYQVFLNEELLFLAGLSGVMFAVLYVIFRPRMLKTSAMPVILALPYTLLTAGILLAYPIYFEFKGPQHFSGLPDFLRPYPYALTVMSYVKLPTLSHWGQPLGNGSSPTGTEQNSMLGWLMTIVVIGIIVALWWRRPAVRALTIVGLFFAWASLGDQVVFNDPEPGQPVVISHMWSLWVHLSHYPVFDSVLASRNALVLVPIVGLLLAFAVADLSRGLVSVINANKALPAMVLCAALAVIVAACVSVVPTPVQVADRPIVPKFFSSGTWRSYVDKGQTVLSATPFDEVQFMNWSIVNNLDFGVAGGYFLGPDKLKPGEKTPLGMYGPQWRTTMLVFGAIGNGSWALPQDDSGYQSQVIPDLKYWNTAIIVLTSDEPYYSQEKASISRLLGNQGEQVDDVWLWDVRSLVK